MANGYLGKISAIVSANTADFDSKLSKSAAEVKKFAGSMEGSLTSARSGAGTALRGIYTDAQRLQRALTAAATQKLSFSAFKGIKEANLAEAIKQMQAVYSVSQQIGKPLAGAAKTMSGLSAGVQAEFLPAMIRAQTATERLSETIDRTGTAGVRQFEAVEKQVTKTVAAMSRMNETKTMVSGLATGQEIRFQRPELSSEMQRSAALQSQAAQMSPAAISSNGVANLVAQQRAAAVETERLAAALENESLLINGNVAGATAAYQSQLAVQRQLNDELQRRIGADAAASKGAADAANAEIAMIQRVQQAEKQAEVERQAQAQKAADAEIAMIQRREQGSKAAEIERQAQAQKAAEAEIAMIQRREQAGKAAEQKRLGTGGFRNLDPDFGTSDRKLLSLRATVGSLQSELERLPIPLQAKFIPAINQVRDELKKLDSTSTSHEIEQATVKAALLGKTLERAGQGARLKGTLRDAINTSAFTKTERQLDVIRSKLIAVGVSANGPVAAAFNNLARYAGNAADEGTLGFGQTQKQLDGYINKLIAAAVAAGNLTAAEGKALNKDVGDVSRGGVDKYSLALNQAAFAVDDFLSSVGGWDQKLRAVSNNITQLAFIAGGTTGLFIGLGAVLGGQAAVGLYKWINNGRTSEDQTKALNDALARQKTLVEDLAEAFRSLGDSMSQGTFSAGGQKASEFTRQLDAITKKQKESAEANLVDVDPAVIKERAEQQKLKNKIEKSSNAGEIVGFQTQMAASKDRENAAAERAAGKPSFNTFGVQRTIQEAFQAMADAIESDVNQFNPDNPGAGEAAAAPFREKSAGVQEAASLSDAKVQLKSTISELSSQVESGFFNSSQAEAAKTQILALRSALSSIEAPLVKEIDDLANKIAEASRGPAAKISQAQEDVAEAIKRGVPSAGAFQRELDSSAKKLRSAYDKLEEAQNERTPEKRQEKVDEAAANIAQVEREMADLDARARELRLGRTFGGERATSALSGLSGERFANERTGATAKLISAIDAEIQARKNLEVATAKGAAAEIKAAEASLEAAQKASEAAAAFAEAIAALEVALARVRRIGERAREKSESGAEAAQRAFEENPLQTGTREARDQAEAQLIQDNARIAEAQRQLDNKRQEIQASPAMGKITDELEAKTQRRKDLEGKAAIGGITPAEQNELDAARKREIELTRQRESLIRTLTDAERRQLDAINNGIAARERENEYNRQRSASSGVFDRVTGGIGQIIESSRRQAEEAIQREINSPSPTNEDMKRTVNAEGNGREDREKAQELQDRLEQKRKEIEGLPKVQENREVIANAQKELADLAQREAASGSLSNGDLRKRERLQEQVRKARDRIEYEIDQGTSGIQNETRAYQRKINNRDRANRGRDLGMTDKERFDKEIVNGAAADINARAEEMRTNIFGAEDPTEFLKQAVNNQMKELAPMLQQFEEERQNALLQGPSRKALQVSDVSTSQGASELTRLIRGDDSAKDVNLAELRKQTQKFDALIAAIKEANPGVLL